MENDKQYDIFIIGGGINGVGIAADTAGRGLKVALCEYDDLASATSSASSKLLHGGIRYLEYYQFRLVREALREREILLNKAPHIIYPWRFVLPHNTYLRPTWLIRLGLYLYDYLAPRHNLAKSEHIKLSQHPYGAPLQPELTTGFVYSDCWVNDARLVILNAMQARDKGALIMPRTEFIAAKRQADHWLITIKNRHTQQTQCMSSKVLINATGPWVEKTIQRIGVKSQYQIALVKGSHIVVPKLYQGKQAYILQNPDKRVIFTEPYEQHYTLIGTTEIPFADDLRQAAASTDEVRYLCDSVNRYFKHNISPNDIVWSYAGVRPLLAEDIDSPSEVSRDYTIDVIGSQQQAYLVNIFGGKITTYRKLAEHVLEHLHLAFPRLAKPWTHEQSLPGGDIPDNNLDDYYKNLNRQYPWLAENLLKRYITTYGSLTQQILKNCLNINDLGELLANGLYAKEIDYLQKYEWAQTVEDILWRRTKLGLHVNENEVARLKNWLQSS